MREILGLIDRATCITYRFTCLLTFNETRRFNQVVLLLELVLIGSACRFVYCLTCSIGLIFLCIADSWILLFRVLIFFSSLRRKSFLEPFWTHFILQPNEILFVPFCRHLSTSCACQTCPTLLTLIPCSRVLQRVVRLSNQLRLSLLLSFLVTDEKRWLYQRTWRSLLGKSRPTESPFFLIS